VLLLYPLEKLAASPYAGLDPRKVNCIGLIPRSSSHYVLKSSHLLHGSHTSWSDGCNVVQ
jgi:hypothetical protein